MSDDSLHPLGPRRAAAALALGALLVVGLAWTARPAGGGVAWRVAFVGLHLAGFALLVALLRVNRPTVRQLLVGALVLRLLALPMLPALSDDGYRYLWDGLISLEAHISPYALVPSDPQLAAWQGEVLFEKMNSPDYYSVYPPVSQAVFRVAALVYRSGGWDVSWWFLKVMLVGAEAVGIVALLRVAGPRGAALYAWSPLAVIEVAGQGHTEGLVVGGLGLILLMGAFRRRIPIGSFGTAIAGLTKLYPLALLPFVWRREGWRGALLTVALVAGFTIPVWTLDAGEHVRQSLSLFFGTFDEYAAPYRIVKWGLYPWLSERAGTAAAGLLAALFAVALAIALSIDDGTRRGLRMAALITVWGFFATVTTLHPWYAVPVLFLHPLLQFHSILWLTALASATYLDYEIPGTGAVVTTLGWGGAFVIWRTGAPATLGRPGRDRL